MDLKKLSEQDCIRIMDEFLDKQNEPKVGIFWYDPIEGDLFGVQSVLASETKFKTINTLHKDYWKKQFNRRKHKGLPLGKFAGDYTQIPRGRVFNTGEGFVVKVGSWINDYPEAKELIIDEFDLEQEVQFDIESHWEIGQGYEG